MDGNDPASHTFSGKVLREMLGISTSDPIRSEHFLTAVAHIPLLCRGSRERDWIVSCAGPAGSAGERSAAGVSVLYRQCLLQSPHHHRLGSADGRGSAGGEGEGGRGSNKRDWKEGETARAARTVCNGKCEAAGGLERVPNTAVTSELSRPVPRCAAYPRHLHNIMYQCC